MSVITIKDTNPEQVIWVVPLSDIIQDLPLFEQAEKHDFTKNEVLKAMVGVADGLLDDDINHCTIYEFITKVLPHVPGYNDLMDMVIECAGRLAHMAPLSARELLYLTCRSGDLPARRDKNEGIERISLYLKMSVST